MKTTGKVELLAPAGNLEKLEIAIHYGADAVYLAGKSFSLRKFSGNFTLEQMQRAIQFAHRRGKKVYVACNVYSRNAEQGAIADYLLNLAQLGPDAVIIADPGVLMLARRLIPQVPIHLSTQANTTNINSVRFWETQGVSRIILARELSLLEIKEIVSECDAEIEVFIHGAMCIAYSGRCLLSGILAQRHSNRGECAHPCRWKYAVVEEFRPGQYLPIAEDGRGSYLFNSKDLCMIEHLPELIRSGIQAFKIEGRMKGINYLASVVKVYREAIDNFYLRPQSYRVEEHWLHELNTISHREYCSGFFINDPGQAMTDSVKSQCTCQSRIVAKILQSNGRRAAVEVRNKVLRGETVEILNPRGPSVKDRIEDIIDGNGRSIPFAQPQSRVTFLLHHPSSRFDIIRRIEK